MKKLNFYSKGKKATKDHQGNTCDQHVPEAKPAATVAIFTGQSDEKSAYQAMIDRLEEKYPRSIERMMEMMSDYDTFEEKVCTINCFIQKFLGKNVQGIDPVAADIAYVGGQISSKVVFIEQRLEALLPELESILL